jgi:predicted ATPase/class 3 adenylate cyclase/GAF domain-containing protein/tRNA A-37 threonylcarbamoyl transferase component Bud32
MATLSDYRLETLLYQGTGTLVWRGKEIGSCRPVVIKQLRSERVTPLEAARFRAEYQLGIELQEMDGLLVPADLVTEHSCCAIIYPHFEGETPRHSIVLGTSRWDRFLGFAIRLTSVLGNLHRRRVIHRDIKPGNILFNPESEEVRLIDFGIATRLSSDLQAPVQPDQLEGTLDYMAPEQTGRMNRPTDYRADYYALGVTFYELLTGRLPFISSDPLEIIHSHLARLPTPPDEICAAIPKPLSRIVLRLMEKTPEARYQGSAAILQDLRACAKAFETTDGIPDTLPLSDVHSSELFSIPSRLYGRERDGQLLASAFAHAGQGLPSLLLVSGPSGIGKSALVHELDQQVFQHQGWFLSGKFEQLRTDRPFSAVSNAIAGMIRQIFTLPEVLVNTWRTEFRAAIGQMGAVLTQLVPDLEDLLGPQPQVPELPPGQMQQRHNDLLLRLISAIPRPTRPVVLFLDDWQWADSASQNWLETVVTAEVPSLLIIAAWRDDEVPESHPFAALISKVLQQKSDAHWIQLSPLSEAQVTDFLCETLRSTAPDLEELPQVLLEKTHGNPFHIRQLLQMLSLENAIQQEPETGRWNIDRAALERIGLTHNVVDLLVTRLRQLPHAVSRPLGVAAAIGAQFDLSLLSLACDQPPATLLTHLAALRSQNLILPEDRVTKQILAAATALDPDDSPDLRAARFRFSHDRIQQAAYALVPEAEKSRLHLSLARTLKIHIPPEEQEERIFEIAGHYLQATPLVTALDERLLAAQILLCAGRAARKACSPEVALSFLTAAIPLLPGDDTAAQPALTTDLIRERGIAAALLGKQAEADAAFDFLLENSSDPATKADVYHWRITLALIRGDFAHAVGSALQGIQLFSLSIPRRPHPLQILWAALQVKRKLRGLVPEQLLARPPMTSPAHRWTLKLLTRGNTGFLFENSMLYALVNIRLFSATLDHGMAPESAGSIAAWAILLCTVLGDPVSAQEFVRVSILHAEASGDPEQRCLCYMTRGGIVSHWCNPLSEGRQWIEKAIQASVECGQVTYAGYCHSHLCFQAAFAGQAPVECIADSKIFSTHARKHDLQDVLLNMLTLHQFSRALLGQTQSPTSLSDESTQQSDLAKSAQHFKAKISLQFMTLCEGRLLFYNNKYPEALDLLLSNTAYDSECVGMTQIPDNAFYLGLAAAGVAREHPRKAPRMRRILRRQIRRFRPWSSLCASNFLPRFLILQGSLLELRGHPFAATKSFETAFEAAAQHGQWHIAALAGERAARIALAHEHPQSARAALRETHYAFSRWGASSLLEKLEREFPFLALETNTYGGQDTIHPLPRRTQPTAVASTSTISQHLDLRSLIKSTQTLSSEIEHGKLVARMLQIVLENAGATRGLLLLTNEEGQLRFEAESFGSGPLRSFHAATLEAPTAPAVSQAAIHLAARQRAPLILHNTHASRELASDDYLRSRPPGALLVLPILHQMKLLGVLYLENSLTTHAFTPSRVGFLTSLASQIAISLENARLYTGLTQLSKAYERFVPKQFLALLGKKRITEVQIGDSTEREMTVLFSDIRNFTSLSEQLSPSENFGFINQYLRCLTRPIRERGGFVDKYIGDAIMALFSEAPDHAIRAAIGMVSALRDYNADRTAQNPGASAIRIGIGINTGDLMLGTVGNEERMDGTVISDSVNLASRVESLTKTYDATVLISEYTWEKLENPGSFKIRRLDHVQVRGKSRPITLYEVFDGDPPQVLQLKSATAAAFDRGITAFHSRDIASALTLFQEIVALNPADHCARFYVERCMRAAS